MSDEEVLEGFFAKKDKARKPKKKKKTKASDDIVKESEIQHAQVDEWKDFEEEKEKDYSNLKISDLQVSGENDKEEQYEEAGDDEVDGESPENDANIWRVNNSSQVPAPQQQPAPAADTPGTQNVVGGKYIPPSLKRQTMAAASQAVPRRRQGAPPDLQSKAAFPTLSAAKQDSDSKVAADFEVVKRGMRSHDALVDDRPALDLGNRYDGLRS